MKVFRKILFWLHLVAGCVAGTVIFAMSLTGALLAFERPLTSWLATPKVVQSPAAERASLESILDAIANSGQGTPSQIVLRSNATAPVEASFGRGRTVYVNPWTAQVIPQTGGQGLRSFFQVNESIHRAIGLGMRNQAGRGIADAANLIFLFIIVSGLYLWLPPFFNAVNLRARLLFKRRLKGKPRDWNWHHAIGIWTLIPLFFVVLSGVFMSYSWASNLLYTMTGSQPPVRGAGPGGPGGPGGYGGGFQGGPGNPNGPEAIAGANQNNGSNHGAEEAGGRSGGSSADSVRKPNSSAGTVSTAIQSGGSSGAAEGRISGDRGDWHHEVGGEEHGGRGGEEGRGPDGFGGRDGEMGGGSRDHRHDAAGGPNRDSGGSVTVDKPSRASSAAAASSQTHGAAAPPQAEPTTFKSLSELATVAKEQVPDWKSISLQVPNEQARAVSITVDRSPGGQPEKSMQMTVDRQSGQVTSVRRFSDNNLGARLRQWARFVHTGEEFGLLGETIGALACLGALFLVWTGISLAIRRASGAGKRSSARNAQILLP